MPLGKLTCLGIIRELQPSALFVHQQNKAIIPSYGDRFNIATYSFLQDCEACLYFLAILFVLRRGIGKRFGGAIRVNYERVGLYHTCKS